MSQTLLLHTMLLLLGPADFAMNQCTNPVTQMYHVYEPGVSINAVRTGSDKSMYAIGAFSTIFERPVDLDPSVGVDLHVNHGRHDLFISRYDSDGNYLWSRSIGGPEDEFINGIVLDSNNNPIAVGYYKTSLDFDPSEGVDLHTMVGDFANSYVTKLLSDGSYAWTATFGKGQGHSLGDTVAVDESDNIYVAGCFFGTLDFDPTEGEDWHASSPFSRSTFITKLWSDGSYAWTRSIDTADNDCGYKIEVDSTDSVIVNGGFKGVVDFDPGVNVDELTAVGQFGNIFVTKYFSDGSYGWTRKMPKHGFATGDIAVDSNDDIYLVSTFENPDDFDPTDGVDWRTINFPGAYDMYVSKLHSDGSYGWTYTAGGTRGIVVKKTTIDIDENILILGSFFETVDFDSGPEEDIHVSLSSNDIFIMKLQPDGTYLWTRTLPGIQNDFSRDIDVDPNGNIFFVGNSFGPIDLNPGCGVDQLTDGKMFIVKLGCVEPNPDANNDGFIDLLDIARFQNCFSSEAPTECNEGCEVFDFDHDDDIDLDDYFEMRLWLE